VHPRAYIKVLAFQEGTMPKTKPFQFSETDDLLDIRYDNVFKAVFTRNSRPSRGALSAMLSAFIGRNVKALAITANEPPQDDTGNRCIRFDINCKAQTGELINVEMSMNPSNCEPVRLEYYAGKLFTSQEIKGTGKDYSNLAETYQIAILAKRRFFRDMGIVHTFIYYDPVYKAPLNGKTRIITVELVKAKQCIGKPAAQMPAHEAWAAFLQYLTNGEKREKINEILWEEGGIAMAGKVLVTISRDEAERWRLTSELKYVLDKQSMRVSARREGFKKGMKEGRKSGLAEGQSQGLADGLVQGKQERTYEIARNLKAGGMLPGDIARFTGLSLEEIANI
jgi:predicted transposase/invertase (TIGR01784 family)